MSGHPRLLRESHAFLDPQATCGLPDCKGGICGGRLRVEDWRPKGGRGQWRYELFCERCGDCDPNGYATQAEVMTDGLEFFGAPEADA